ncbi:MAG: hypothetical protein ACWA47_05375 [Brevirhabdus sp.]
MTKPRWHNFVEDGALVVTRRLPVRFDISAATDFPPARMGRLAHQVRQDLWRALRDIRGFSPVVLVEEVGDRLCLTAGGRLDCRASRSKARARVADLLADPKLRARWLANAQMREET